MCAQSVVTALTQDNQVRYRCKAQTPKQHPTTCKPTPHTHLWNFIVAGRLYRSSASTSADTHPSSLPNTSNKSKHARHAAQEQQAHCSISEADNDRLHETRQRSAMSSLSEPLACSLQSPPSAHDAHARCCCPVLPPAAPSAYHLLCCNLVYVVARGRLM